MRISDWSSDVCSSDLIGGQTYADIPRPASVVGAALEAASFHPGRSALNHLRVLAPLAGVADQRCRDVLEHVGLGPVGDRQVGGFSMGMRQRLGLATTLLGDPGVLVLDEPDRTSTRLNSSHYCASRLPSSA